MKSADYQGSPSKVVGIQQDNEPKNIKKAPRNGSRRNTGLEWPFSTETHEELYNKGELLDKWEAEIFANIQADYLYR
uniref:Uncharacterized protein n=1 Tax=Hucho hucho TaxID=62062 RepID=A0A4W5R035_9TELE